jgi:hypothetical protein
VFYVVIQGLSEKLSGKAKAEPAPKSNEETDED